MLVVVAVFGRAYNPRGLLEVRQALENVNKVEDLLPIMKVRKTAEVGMFQIAIHLSSVDEQFELFSHSIALKQW